MLVEEFFSRVIGNTNVPSLRITTFSINEFQQFQDYDIRGFRHANTVVNLFITRCHLEPSGLITEHVPLAIFVAVITQ